MLPEAELTHYQVLVGVGLPDTLALLAVRVWPTCSVPPMVRDPVMEGAEKSSTGSIRIGRNRAAAVSVDDDTADG